MNKKLGTIKGKISIMMISTSILLLVGILLASRIVSEKNVVELCENYMYDVCISASDTLYESFWGDTEQTDMTVRLEFILNSVGIEGMKSSEACLVDRDGVYLYSKDRSKIGTVIEGNSVIQEVIDTYKEKDVITTADVRECNVDGTDKYVAFICTVNNWILFVQADKSEVMRPINSMNMYCVIVGIILVVVIICFAYVITSIITRPIKPLTTVIHSISEFDLSKQEKIPAAKDEIGIMGSAVIDMKGKLAQIVAKLNNISENLLHSSDELNEISREVNMASTDNSATTEQLAAGMQETSASSESINSSISDMQSGVSNVTGRIREGTRMTHDIMEKSEALSEQSEQANQNIMRMYDEIKKVSQRAIERASHVDKINELTGTIQDIAEETTLLSLNASIEAARAGENGRGFAVVADQIGKLADQSANTAESISDIVGEVNESVKTLMNCLKQTLEFLGTDVTKDYDNFLTSGKEYKEAAEMIQNFMIEAEREAEQLERGIGVIFESMTSINSTISEAANGVYDIAGKTTEVVNYTDKLYMMTSECRELSQQLNDITSSFRMG